MRLALAAADDIVVAGRFKGAVDFGIGPLVADGEPDAYVAKLTSDGTPVWNAKFGGPATELQGLIDVAVGSAGDITVASTVVGPIDCGGMTLDGAGGDVWIARLGATGALAWCRRFGDASGQKMFAMATDPAGATVIAGMFNGTMDFGPGGVVTNDDLGEDMFVAKLDVDGVPVWSRSYDEGYEPYDVATDPQGNILVVGNDGPGGVGALVTKLDASGVELWTHLYGGSSNDQFALAVAIDAVGGFVIAGASKGDVDFGGGPISGAGTTDVFLARFDAAGDHVWSKGFGDAEVQVGWSVAFDPDDRIAVAGTFLGAVDFGGGPLVSAGGNSFGGDIFLAVLEGNGGHVASTSFGDVENQTLPSVAFGATGVALTAAFWGTVDTGTGPLTSAGMTDTLLAKWSCETPQP